MSLEAGEALGARVWEEVYAASRGQELPHPSAGSPDGDGPRGFSRESAQWDARAEGFARKPRSPYAATLLGMLPLEEGDSVLDFGCGPGTLTVPLARAGHPVTGVDFSHEMLVQLERAAREAGVAVATRQLAWQDSWDTLPRAQLVVSSRSFVPDTLGEGVSKLEGRSLRSVVVTLPAGDRPWLDPRLSAAIGRRPVERSDEAFVALVNYLWALGRFPRVDYILLDRPWSCESLDELQRVVAGIASPQSPEEARALEDYVARHAAPVGDGIWLDYRPVVRWGVVAWEVPQDGRPEGPARAHVD